LDKMTIPHKSVKEKAALLHWIKEQYAPSVNKEFGELLIAAGAGDIDTLVEPIKNLLKEI